ncbi:hypothetical protein Y032_0009g433 [Ancylostoma ceylanicum]|uniref:Uncharacterized protein n=1 Tax=Ancylostoma ceylanicum TaxID=53326 RepID=A0A016VJJ3_9BILA|nr:hypothetical protein Y032_0009g433 [Ancylostoma ceylanicum]
MISFCGSNTVEAFYSHRVHFSKFFNGHSLKNKKHEFRSQLLAITTVSKADFSMSRFIGFECGGEEVRQIET